MTKEERTKACENAPVGAFPAGPRNLPKPDARKRRRLQQKASRKANR